MVRVLGVRRALAVEVFVMLWSLFRLCERRDPDDAAEFADAMGKSRATVYRWLEDFHAAYPEFATPGDFLDWQDVAKRRVVSRRDVAEFRTR